jgi:hypothetical protein
MGKGTILSGGTDGQYQVQVNYDQTAYDARVAALDATIAQYEAEIVAWTGDDAGLAALELGKASAEVSKAYLVANMPADETISAWCADLTEDLAGAVGTIEIPGESVNFNIQPGSAAAYSAARDGQLVPTISQTPAAAFYNLAMLPGWQKWMPNYRYGVISDLSGDVCTVTLDAATSSQQGIDVNQDTVLSSVAIDYMDCNGTAFEDGDSVLVQFTGQDFASPKVIGFKDNPKPCSSGFHIRPTFNGNYAVNGGQSIRISYTFESIEYSQTVSVSQELESYTTFIEIPKEVLDAETVISVYVGTDPELFTYYQNVGVAGDYDTEIHWGVPETVYLKKVLEKEAVDTLPSIPTGQVEVEGKDYDYYEVEFVDLKLLRRRPIFAMYSRESYYGDLTYVDGSYPNCILNAASGSEPDYDLTHDSYYRTFEAVYDSPTKCIDAVSTNAYGDPGEEYCESYATTSTTESSRIEDVASIVVLAGETGENPSFNAFTRVITDRVDYELCEECPWGECVQAGGAVYVEGTEYHMTWRYELVDTPVNYL